jgi:pimeloyl-ACP methyl ester carboxylesterase
MPYPGDVVPPGDPGREHGAMTMDRRDFMRLGTAASLASLPLARAAAASSARRKAPPAAPGSVPTPPSAIIDRGHGKPVIFSHGFMMDRTMFAPQIEALSPHYRTIAYDSRARTPYFAGPYDLYNLTDDCCRLMDERGIDKAVIVGMSMGGWMAQRFALRHPDRISALILIGSTPSGDAAERRAKFAGLFEPLRGKHPLPKDYVDFVANQCFGATTEQTNARLIDTWRDRMTAYNGEAVYWEAVSWEGRDDLRDQDSRIKVPTLIVAGAEDRAAPPEIHAKALHAAIPQSEVVIVPGAGHTVNLEQPGPVNDAIAAFLARNA